MMIAALASLLEVSIRDGLLREAVRIAKQGSFFFVQYFLAPVATSFAFL
jgi:hypothetical protein